MAGTFALKGSVGLDARDFVRGASESAESVDEIADALEASDDAVEDFIDTLRSATKIARDELDQTGVAVQAMSEQLDGVDLDASHVVAELQAAGLTAQQVTEHAAELGEVVREINDVNLSAAGAELGAIDTQVNTTSESTGRLRTNMSSFAGQAIGDLPGVSGAIGPVRQGIESMVDGLVDTRVKFSDLAPMVGVMAGIGAAVWGVNKAMESVADSKAFHAERVAGFKDAIDEVGEGVEAIRIELEATEGVLGRVGGIKTPFGDFFEGTEDVTATLQAAGVSFIEYSLAIDQGGDALDHVIGKLEASRDALWAEREAQIAAGESGHEALMAHSDMVDAIEAVLEARGNYKTAIEEERALNDWLNEGLDEQATSYKLVDDAIQSALAEKRADAATNDDLRSSYYLVQQSIEDAIVAIREQEDAVRDLREENRRLTDDFYDQFDAVDNYLDGLDRYAEAEARAAEAGDTSAGTQRELAAMRREAARDLDEFITMQLEFNDVNVDSVEGQEAWIDSMLESASFLSGPLQDQVLAYIATMQGIPQERITEILADADPDNLAQVEKELDDAAADRAAGIDAEARATADAAAELDAVAAMRFAEIEATVDTSDAESDLNRLTQDRRVNIYSYLIPVKGNRADGGPVEAGGTYLVGERGPEVVTFDRPGYVHSNDTFNAMTARGAAPAVVTDGGAGDVSIGSIRLFIGDREVSDMVRVELDGQSRLVGMRA